MSTRLIAYVAYVAFAGVLSAGCQSSSDSGSFTGKGGASGAGQGGGSGGPGSGGSSAGGSSAGGSSAGGSSAGGAGGSGAGDAAAGGSGGAGGATDAAAPMDSGGGGLGAVVPSTGCGMTAPAPASMIGTSGYGKFTMSVTAQSVAAFNASPGNNQPAARQYFVRLPNNYNPAKAYRVIYLGPGCGPAQDTQTTPKALPLHTDPNSTGATTDAILVQMEQGTYNPAAYNPATCRFNNTTGCNAASAYCFDDWASEAGAPMVSTIPDGNNGAVAMERAYFDALHKTIEAKYCVDKNRQFFGGYSSGGWLAQQLGCWFPDVLRAQGNVTGGLPPIIRANVTGGNDYCVKHPIAAFLIHNNPDVSNDFTGSVESAKRIYALNGCTGVMPGGGTAGGPPLPNSTTPLPPGLELYSIPGAPNSNSFRCYRYTTCPVDYPIVFCVATDSGHQDQHVRADPGFWQFFSSF